jgi:hypothetical protein
MFLLFLSLQKLHNLRAFVNRSIGTSVFTRFALAQGAVLLNIRVLTGSIASAEMG